MRFTAWAVLVPGISLAAIGARVAPSAAAEPFAVYQEVVGEEAVYAVRAGDTLGHIAARFGIKTQLAAVINRLPDPDRLRVGQRLWLSNRRVVPATLNDGLVVNVGDLGLYWLRETRLVAYFPVGVGRAAWRTPPGQYTIANRRRDPTWYVPPSIQREMRERGEPVRRKVPPGPDNPLGKYWLQLSLPGYGIHGTNAPWTVGSYTTHGCIRLHPEHIEQLYAEVANGTAVHIIDEPIKLARLADGTVWLEAHRSPTDGAAGSVESLAERLQASGVQARVHLAAAKRVVEDAWGVAVAVSRDHEQAAAGDATDAP